MKHLLALFIALVSCSPAFAAKRPPYTYVRVGNASNVTTPVTPGIVLMGGGTDVDAAFQWMCGRAGNGDFLVIRATGFRTNAGSPNDEFRSTKARRIVSASRCASSGDPNGGSGE